MILVRIVAILVAIAVGAGIVLFIATGNREFLKFSLQLLKWAVVAALLFFALLILERLTSLA